MDTIRTALFEDPVWLLGLLWACEMVALLLWRKRRTRGLRRAVIALPVVMAIVALLAWVVVTDREQIERACGEIAADVTAGNADVLGSYLADDCLVDLRPLRGRSLGGAEIVADIERHIRVSQIEAVKLTRMSVDVDGDTAHSEVTAIVTSNMPDVMGRSFPLSWDVEWVKEPAGWRIHRVKLVRTEGFGG